MYVHPVADEATDRWLVYDTRASHVALTEPLRVLLEIATTDALRPVVVTGSDARLSPLATASLAEAGGSWVVRSDDGPFDATTGQVLGSFHDLWNPPTRLHPTFSALAEPTHPVVTYDVYTGLRADPETCIGSTARTMTRALGGVDLGWWGTAEPLLDPWDTDKITAFARARMPRTPPVLFSGPDAQYARTWVGRARHGLVERTAGGVQVPASTLADLVPTAADALVAANARSNVLAGMVWAGTRGDHATTAPGPHPVDQPLAVLIGPQAVRDLGIDVSVVAEHHDTQAIGRERAPSLLVRLSSGADQWSQLVGLAQTLGPQAIARAVGWSPDAS